MFPGIGKIDAKKMQGMMKQMGINSEEIEAERVIIEKLDGRIVIENPNIQKIKMQGQESWQITGEAKEENDEEDLDEEEVREEDIKLVMAKTGRGRESVKRVLEESDGDIAEAIVRLSS